MYNFFIFHPHSGWVFVSFATLSQLGRDPYRKRLLSKMLGSLDFTGREGGIRTHGGSSPHLISSFLALVFAIVRNSKEALILLDLKAFSSIDIPCKSRLNPAVFMERVPKMCPSFISLKQQITYSMIYLYYPILPTLFFQQPDTIYTQDRTDNWTAILYQKQ